jgi:hypothetical protein
MQVFGARGSTSSSSSSWTAFSPVMYVEPPTTKITMDFFEQSAFDRLQLLNYLDSMDMSANANNPLVAQQLADEVKRKCEELGLNDPLKGNHFS